ncbi:MAG: sodium/proton-translocating pyrophosphatase, partial [Actinomycetota bacterium]
GDCAGMAADLFETYVVTTVATMVLAAIALPAELRLAGMVLPTIVDGAAVAADGVIAVDGVENTGLSSMELTVTSPVLHPPSTRAATELSAAASSTPRGTVRSDDEGE